MDLRWSDDERSFRDEIRAFLDEHLPAEWRLVRLDNDLEQGSEAIRRQWQERLHRHGWLQLSWPVAAGGRGASRMLEAIYQAELAEAGAPPIWGRAGVYLLAPTLLRHATPQQQTRFINPILSGDVFFCQAFSEPDAGSDLASLKSTAVRVTGGWRVTGQKCWSSGAMHADRAFLLARSDRDAPRHRAIGFFLVDLRQPGVEVRPTKQLSGESEFAEIFLDDVFVSDDDVVDDPSAGWSVAMTTFSFERAAIANGMLLERAMQTLIDRARRLEQAGDPLVRQRLARLLSEVRAFSWLSLRDLTRYEAGAEVGADASLSKLGWSETGKRLRALAVELRGLHAVATGPDETDPWLGLWMWAVAQTIYGGTSEIQRNIVAERLLELPRVP